jgi:enoyl-CoA hydratase/carnithine racemase
LKDHRCLIHRGIRIATGGAFALPEGAWGFIPTKNGSRRNGL